MSYYGNDSIVLNEVSVYDDRRNKISITVDEGTNFPNFKYDPYIKVYQHGGFISSNSKCCRISLKDMRYIIHYKGADFEPLSNNNKNLLNEIFAFGTPKKEFSNCKNAYEAIIEEITKLQNCTKEEIVILSLEKINFNDVHLSDEDQKKYGYLLK